MKIMDFSNQDFWSKVLQDFQLLFVEDISSQFMEVGNFSEARNHQRIQEPHQDTHVGLLIPKHHFMIHQSHFGPLSGIYFGQNWVCARLHNTGLAPAARSQHMIGTVYSQHIT
ncbi:hypothetical protein AALO_G00185670 [Alosa alosa]|uniref:Uncharacterized protein n=1 Tax=Alosa alosa TaxID=278164 RepID=A0AAV6GED4_9TELE|nr:hypothetical protein AALO_G00185670 [Alosa alosa]